MKSFAKIYKLGEKGYLVETVHFQSESSRFTSDYFTLLDMNVSAEAIGDRIQAHLAASQWISFDSKAAMQNEKNKISKAGFRSQKQYFEIATSVGIEFLDSKYLIRPYNTVTNKRMFAGVPEGIVTLPASIGVTQLGETILAAFDICKFVEW
jgi:hypothetical protein